MGQRRGGEQRVRRGSGRRGSAALRALADDVGIIAEYVDQTGKERRRTSDDTRVALLAALGFPYADDAGAARQLRERRAQRAASPLDAVRVSADASSPFDARLPAGWSPRVDWELELIDESGGAQRVSGRATAKARRLPLTLPAALSPGYYTARLTLHARGRSAGAEQQLIIVPPKCASPETVLGGQRVAGLTANVYTLRSARNWGVGDTTDLRALVEWSAEIGLAFVGLSPLHALRNRGHAISPYGPVSRLFRNPLYIDVESVPEWSDDAARETARRTDAALAALRAADRVDYERVMSQKRPVLEVLHRRFVQQHRGQDTRRGRAYAEYLSTQGEALEDFATWCVIDEREQGRPWREWTPELHDAHGAAVRALRVRERERVDFHRWLQFELDRQLGVTQDRARASGMPIGLYQDLAIGAAGDSSDTWVHGDLFVRGVAIGAPPDPYAAEGQNWGLPAVNPHRMAASGYAYWVQLVRAGLRHSGALRIDHVLGLFRQFWIPDGRRGSDGAYVRFPADDLLGILALESERAGALIVGEDLGTVPPDVPPGLERWGVLSSKVLYFEMDRDRFKPPSAYPRLALTTANTHDMPTLSAFWRERDIDLREEVGAIATKRGVAQARQERMEAREALAMTLVEEGLWPAAEEPSTDLALRAGVHAFLRRTPSVLVGLSLDDLTGEIEPVNLPGVSSDRWPCWSRRMTMSIEDIRTSPDVQRALGEERKWIPRR